MRSEKESRGNAESLFQLNNIDQKNISYKEIIKCKNGRPCINLCHSEYCESNAVVCSDEQCSCKEGHNKSKFCSMGLLQAIVQMTENNKVDYSELLNWINTKYDELIDWISDERQKVYLLVESYGLSKVQKVFLETVYTGQCEELTGTKVHQVVRDLNLDCQKIKENMALMHQKLSDHWQQFFEKTQKEVKALNQLIIGAPLIIYEAKVENAQSPTHLGSKVAVTETERLTVTDMLNSSGERKVYGYVLLYRASDSNFQVQKFWQKCDQKANTVTLIRTEFDKIIGGYTPLSWKIEKGSGNGNFEQDSSLRSFVFSITQKTKFALSVSQKHRAIQHDLQYGPIFGLGRDILVYNNSNQITSSARIGYGYKNSRVQYDTKESFKFFQGSTESKHFKIKEWQVWQVVFK